MLISRFSFDICSTSEFLFCEINYFISSFATISNIVSTFFIDAFLKKWQFISFVKKINGVTPSTKNKSFLPQKHSKIFNNTTSLKKINLQIWIKIYCTHLQNFVCQHNENTRKPYQFSDYLLIVHHPHVPENNFDPQNKTQCTVNDSIDENPATLKRPAYSFGKINLSIPKSVARAKPAKLYMKSETKGFINICALFLSGDFTRTTFP